MEVVSPFEWERLMFGVEPPLYLLEIIVRVVLIYVYAVLALRYMGKRGRQALSPFELVLIIALGSATGDAMFYPEVPVVYAWLIISIVVVLDRVLAAWEVRSHTMKVFLAGRPRLMVKDGELIQESLEKESISAAELLGLLREERVADLSQVAYAFLETTGRLAVIERGQFESASTSTYPEDLAR